MKTLPLIFYTVFLLIMIIASIMQLTVIACLCSFMLGWAIVLVAIDGWQEGMGEEEVYFRLYGNMITFKALSSGALFAKMYKMIEEDTRAKIKEDWELRADFVENGVCRELDK